MSTKEASSKVRPEDLVRQAREIIDKAKKEAHVTLKEAQAQAKELHRLAKDEAKAMRNERKKTKRHGKYSMKRDRFLHLRIDDELESKIQDEAERKRIPISILVRDILNDAFDLVENVVDNVGALVEDVVGDAGRFARSLGEDKDELDPEEVVAWQKVRLNRAAECPFCGVEMKAGDSAHLGLMPGKSGQVFVPEGCKHAEPDITDPVCKASSNSNDEEEEKEKDAGSDSDE